MSTGDFMAAQGSAMDAPVRSEDRIILMDVIRGFAVMAIFVVNIKGMAMPFAYYMNPAAWGSPLSEHIAIGQKFLVDDRWRTIFTMLFGAGLVLMGTKSAVDGSTGAGRLVRRNLWLAAFGAIHLFLIWIGDILFLYGMTGLLALGFRNFSIKALIFWAIFFLVLGTAWMGGFGMMPAFIPEMRAEVEPLMWSTDGAEVAWMLGTIPEQISARASEAFDYLVIYNLLGGGFMVTLGLMLWGMVFFKSGLLKGAWSVPVCFALAVVGLGAASVLEWMQVTQLIDSDYDYGVFAMNTPLMLVDGYLGAVGFLGLLAGLVGLGLKFGPVAAVGRMAFTNYIACSLIGTTIANGHGGAIFGTAELPQLMAIVVGTFVCMLIWSPLWLSVFRFGPLEWLWRSLTYGRIQPFRR